jgi:trehalose-phosphatase
MNLKQLENKLLEMEPKTLKLYAVNAVILAFFDKVPSRTQIREWKDNHISIALIHPNNGLHGSDPIYSELEGLIDAESCLEDVPASISNAESYLLRTALRKLNTQPGKTVLLTDDPRYIHAARASRLAMAIGVGSPKGKLPFYEKGAKVVLDSLEQISIFNGSHKSIHFSQRLPNPFIEQLKFQSFAGRKKPIFFFDYDGTLTPIVKDPEKAVIGEDVREILKELSHMFHVAVISGRDMDHIRDFIRLESIIYAGSHGYRISGPGGLHMEKEQAKKILPVLHEVETILKKSLEQEIRGVQIERKQYAIAIHYRNAPSGTPERINKVVRELIQGYDSLKTGRGKKILEVKPSMDWHKGKAVRWILEELGLTLSGEYLPVYFGDDITDEDAFRTLSDDGIGILVGEHDQPSAADYQLKDEGQVKQFLHYVVHSGLIPEVY